MKNLDNIKIYGGIDSAVLFAFKGEGAVLPQGLDDPLDPLLKDVGWINEDGVNISVSVESGEIIAWQGGTAVLFPVTSSSKTVQFTAMEDTPLVARMYYNASAPVAAGGGAARIDLPGSIGAVEGAAVVKSTTADGIVKYYVLPLVSITDRGDAGHSASDPTTHQMTMAIRGDAYVITNHPAYLEALATPWAASTAYTAGQFVELTGGERLEATTGGTSGTTEPTAPATVGGTVTDGTVTWTRRS